MAQHRNNCHLLDMKPSFENEAISGVFMNCIFEIFCFVQWIHEVAFVWMRLSASYCTWWISYICMGVIYIFICCVDKSLCLFIIYIYFLPLYMYILNIYIYNRDKDKLLILSRKSLLQYTTQGTIYTMAVEREKTTWGRSQIHLDHWDINSPKLKL